MATFLCRHPGLACPVIGGHPGSQKLISRNSMLIEDIRMMLLQRRGRDLNPRIEGFADLAIRPLWYRAICQHTHNFTVIADLPSPKQARIRNLTHSFFITNN